MPASSGQTFKRHYETHLKHLKLKGLQPKTIEAYARAIRRIGAYFDHDIEGLSEQQLTEYFTDLLDSHSWSAVKLDLYAHVLHKPWVNVDLVKPPKAHRLPDIVTVEEATHLIEAGVDRLEVQKILGHRSILTTARYTRLTSNTQSNAKHVINALMNGFSIDWRIAK